MALIKWMPPFYLTISLKVSKVKVVLKKRLSQKGLTELIAKIPLCSIGMEACSTAHYVARKLSIMLHDYEVCDKNLRCT